MEEVEEVEEVRLGYRSQCVGRGVPLPESLPEPRETPLALALYVALYPWPKCERQRRFEDLLPGALLGAHPGKRL